MVMDRRDPLELSDYERTLIGKAATRIELPLITSTNGDALAPADWRDIFTAVKAWIRDCEFEVSGRQQNAVQIASAIEYRTKTVNRELRFIRERAAKAAEDRKAQALADKVRTIKSFGLRPVDSDLDSKSGTR